MAPLPKKKHTRARAGKRRLNKKLVLSNIQFCPSCKKPKKPHRECSHCGYFHKKA